MDDVADLSTPSSASERHANTDFDEEDGEGDAPVGDNATLFGDDDETDNPDARTKRKKKVTKKKVVKKVRKKRTPDNRRR